MQHVANVCLHPDDQKFHGAVVEDLQAQLAALGEEKEAVQKQHQAHMADADERLHQATAKAEAAAEKHLASKLALSPGVCVATLVYLRGSHSG